MTSKAGTCPPAHAPALGWLAVIAAVLMLALQGCAHVASSHPEPLFDDAAYGAPAQPVDADSLFSLSADMKRYAEQVLASPTAARDRRQALIDSLYARDGGLQLVYDASATRNAAEAFAARAGNCLSLVVMTAAFAKHFGLPVTYQTVQVDEAYNRAGDLSFVSGHVNIVLGRHVPSRLAGEAQWLTIDFLPQEDLRGQRTQAVEERTVLAMYLNNKAAEALAERRDGDAYWWAAEALRRDPAFVAAANTLGVIHQRAGHVARAEAAFAYVLERERDNTSALANLSRLLRDSGRAAEADAMARRLAALQPYPPFWFLDHGREALERGDARSALDLFRRELRRQPMQHEVHFALARAHAMLGDAAATAEHLALAARYSPTRRDQALYAGKLERLRAYRHN